MRKPLAILLLTCLIINIIGYHIIFYFSQYAIKTEMKKMILSQSNNKDEDDFVFNLNDKAALAKLEWDGDDEFSLNGDMYDVIEKKIEKNKLIVRALADKRETSLLKKYSDINNDHNSNNKTAILIKLVSGAYLFQSGNIFFAEKMEMAFQVSFQPAIISPNNHDVLTPPPQVC